MRRILPLLLLTGCLDARWTGFLPAWGQGEDRLGELLVALDDGAELRVHTNRGITGAGLVRLDPGETTVLPGTLITVGAPYRVVGTAEDPDNRFYVYLPVPGLEPDDGDPCCADSGMARPLGIDDYRIFGAARDGSESLRIDMDDSGRWEGRTTVYRWGWMDGALDHEVVVIEEEEPDTGWNGDPDTDDRSGPDGITSEIAIEGAVRESGSPPAATSGAPTPTLGTVPDEVRAEEGGRLRFAVPYAYDESVATGGGLYVQVRGASSYFDLRGAGQGRRTTETEAAVVVDLGEVAVDEFCFDTCAYVTTDGGTFVTEPVTTCIEIAPLVTRWCDLAFECDPTNAADNWGTSENCAVLENDWHSEFDTAAGGEPACVETWKDFKQCRYGARTCADLTSDFEGDCTNHSQDEPCSATLTCGAGRCAALEAAWYQCRFDNGYEGCDD